MSGYASKAEAIAVVRATIAGSNRPADLPDDLSVYILSRIYSAVVTSRGPGYGWAIECSSTVFWDAVRANLRDKSPKRPTPGMSWGEVAERDAAGHCSASLDYNEPHIADGDVCSECGAELDTPALAPDYADVIAARILGSSDNTYAYRAAVEAARAGYALGLGVSS